MLQAPRRVIAISLALTGFSALALQVVWQRVISIHSGVDLSSSTTVVAGFLAGLGLGSLLGGRLADRIGPRRSVGLLAGSNLAVGLFAWWSTALFYDLYREVAADLTSTWATVGFNFVLLLIPTTLQGMSIPLVAKILTVRAQDSGPLLGRMSGINTMSAAFGSVIAGWYLVGAFGFVVTTRITGTMNIVAGVLIASMLVPRRVQDTETWAAPPGDSVDDSPDSRPAEEGRDIAIATHTDDRTVPPWLWPLVYGITGTIALGYQVVFFRLIDVVMRSNSYSFSLVLALYLGFWALGAWGGAKIMPRFSNLPQAFFGLQLTVAVSAAVGVGLLVVVAPALGARQFLVDWFSTNGFVLGYDPASPFRQILFGVVLPAGLLGVPILCTGAAFPVVQGLVARRISDLGWRTGLIGFANTVGNVVGVILTGFVLIDWLGTAGTLRLLTGTLGLIAVVGLAASVPRQRLRRSARAAVAVIAAVLIAPDSTQLWDVLHGEPPQLKVSEDHTCISAAKGSGDRDSQLFINGSSQNNYPFDDFHVLVGLLPSLVVKDQARGLAIGFGAGSTSYSMLLDPRVRHVTTVELCTGNYAIAEQLARDGVPEFVSLFNDDRHEPLTGDGRRFLVVDKRRHDLVVVDTLRPTSANSGSHYSKEFYELLDQRMADHGVLAQWVPGGRVLNSVSQVFPYVITVKVPTYNDSMMFLASRSPLDVDAATLLRRFDAISEAALTDVQRTDLREWLVDWNPACVNDGQALTAISSDQENRDLRPRDEYFLNNRNFERERASSNC